MNTQNKPVNERWRPWLAGLFTFAVHAATACRSIDPLLSARPVAEHLGLTPFPPLIHPLWGTFIRLVATLPVPLAGGLNILHALCMGVSAGLLFDLMQQWTWNVPEKYRHPGRVKQAGTLSALVAVAFFTIAPPAWIAGTRAIPVAFGLMLLMIALRLLLHIVAHPRPLPFLCFMLLWGLGITEYNAFILSSPLFLLTLTAVWWQKRRPGKKFLAAGVLLFIAALSIYFFSALAYARSPAYQWREFTNLFQVLWYILREQYIEMKSGMVAIGWLLILTFLFIPWLILLLYPLTQQRRTHYRATAHFLFLVLAVILVVILFNIRPAPWTFTRLYPLIVLPYLIFAAWAGRLAATYYLVLSSPDRHNRQSRVRKLALVLATLALAAAYGTAAFRNYAIIDTRPLHKIHQLADSVVENMQGRKFLINHGFLDFNMLIAAHERNQTLHLINPALAISPSYRRYIASLFDNPRLQNLATINLHALMIEWSKNPEEITATLGVLQQPDVWSRLGFTPLPRPLVYFGYAEKADCPAAREGAGYWQDNGISWLADINPRNIAAAWIDVTRTMLSQANNNLGVALEDCNMPDLAFEAYQTASRLDTNNLSSLMNRLVLLRRNDDPEAEILDQELKHMVESQRRRANFWMLSSRYGYIREPQAYIAKGFAWAISGKPAAAIREIKQAIDLSGENPAMQILLARLYIASDDPEAGRQTYEQLLEQDPDSPDALLGMAQLAVRQNQIHEARQYLDKLSSLGIDTTAPAIEGLIISMAIQSEDYPATRDLLRSMIRRNPDNGRLWATLALLANEEDDKRTIEECARALSDAIRTEPLLAMVMAQIEIRRNNLKSAQDYLIRAIRRQPTALELREQLLKVLVNLRLRDDAENEARSMLSIDPAHPFANYIMGTIQESRGDIAFAENSFRASLESRRDPHALNDLAWLLARRGQAADALPLIEESLELLPANPSALDTYGLVLIDLGRLDEAEDILRQALTYQPNNPFMQYHLARVFEEKGLAEQAVQIARPVMDRMHEIPPELYEDARAIVMRAQHARQPDTGELIPPAP